MSEESSLSNQSLLRRTLVMVGVMVGACVFVVGTLTIVASSIVGHAVGSEDDAADAGPGSAAPGTPAKPGVTKTRPIVDPSKRK